MNFFHKKLELLKIYNYRIKIIFSIHANLELFKFLFNCISNIITLYKFEMKIKKNIYTL